jgi:protein gp37
VSDNSKIEWTDATWNPVVGCTPVSEACEHCYALRFSRRISGMYGYPDTSDGTFPVTERPQVFEQPLKWQRPRKIFVASMGDLFHNSVRDDTLDMLLRIMMQANWHTFQLLTKRPERMRDVMNAIPLHKRPNIWIGVTGENQQRFDERVRILVQIAAAVRFVSCEPLLGEIDTRPYLPKLGWVIVGAETGLGKRIMNWDWAQQIHRDCIDAKVPFFFKKDSWGKPLYLLDPQPKEFPLGMK